MKLYRLTRILTHRILIGFLIVLSELFLLLLFFESINGIELNKSIIETLNSISPKIDSLSVFISLGDLILTVAVVIFYANSLDKKDYHYLIVKFILILSTFYFVIENAPSIYYITPIIIFSIAIFLMLIKNKIRSYAAYKVFNFN